MPHSLRQPIVAFALPALLLRVALCESRRPTAKRSISKVVISSRWSIPGSARFPANWNSGKAHDSLSWFASRGHRQIIAGYYDSDDLAGLEAWKSAAHGVDGVFGFMYTTWQSRFRMLERYGAELKKAP